MGQYLEFKPSSCKNCYRCLRECPVKAIKVVDQKAVIMEDLCILCGKCTFVCHQNAKYVHGELEEVKRLLKKHKKVYVSVAPSFVSSFGIENFEVMRVALKRLGFFDAEETAVGAAAVTEKYEELLKSGRYRNLISSACPAVNRLIEIYRPKALPFLAPVDTPMVGARQNHKETRQGRGGFVCRTLHRQKTRGARKRPYRKRAHLRGA